MRVKCAAGCGNDHSSVCRSLQHFHQAHQSVRCRFQCPRCENLLGAALHDKDREHVLACYGRYPDANGKQGGVRFPAEELWEMERVQWEGSLAYKGDRYTVDPYTFLPIFAKPSRRNGDWVLRMNIMQMLLDQLAMLQLYGGCTLNVDEVIVPGYVYDGLAQLLLTDPALRPIRLPPTQLPPPGIPARLARLLVTSQSVTDARANLASADGLDRSQGALAYDQLRRTRNAPATVRTAPARPVGSVDTVVISDDTDTEGESRPPASQGKSGKTVRVASPAP